MTCAEYVYLFTQIAEREDCNALQIQDAEYICKGQAKRIYSGESSRFIETLWDSIFVDEIWGCSVDRCCMGCKTVQFWQNCTDSLSVPAASVIV
jgi:hypothetical protein